MLKTVVNSSTKDVNSFPIEFQALMENQNAIERAIQNQDAVFLARLIYNIEQSPDTINHVLQWITYESRKIGVVVEKDGHVYLAFRGTKTLEEWNKDLLFQQLKVGTHILEQPEQVNMVSIANSFNADAASDLIMQYPIPYGNVHKGKYLFICIFV